MAEVQLKCVRVTGAQTGDWLSETQVSLADREGLGHSNMCFLTQYCAKINPVARIAEQ